LYCVYQLFFIIHHQKVPIYKTSKEEILVKASMVFREKGYHHTSIQNLAEACGLKKPHFYYYFKKGKPQLMEEVLKYIDSLMEKYICELAYDEKYTPENRLQKMLSRMNEFYLNGPGGCIFANTLLETANVSDRFKPIIKDTFDKWAKALQFVLAAKYEATEARKLAFSIIQDMEGGLMMYQLYNDEQFMKMAEERSIALLKK